MSEIRNAVLDFIRPLKRERKENPCTHIITWGYTAESQLALDGDFAYCYGDQIDGAIEILAKQPEVDGIVVSAIEIVRHVLKGDEWTHGFEERL